MAGRGKKASLASYYQRPRDPQRNRKKVVPHAVCSGLAVVTCSAVCNHLPMGALSKRTGVLSTADVLPVPSGVTAATVSALRIVLALAALHPTERRILDLRPAAAFAQAHLRHSVHVPGGPDALVARFSSLPPRQVPFVVVCQHQHYHWVQNNLGGLRRRVQGVVICRDTDPTPSDTPFDPSDSEFWRLAQIFRLTAATPMNLPHERVVDPSDRPRFLGLPAPVVHRVAECISRQLAAGEVRKMKVLDLGCGAGRDIAWLCYEHGWRPHGAGVDWTAVGADNLRPVLERAKVVLNDFGLFSPPEGKYGQIAKLVWSEVLKDGSMNALAGPGRGPRGASRLDAGPSATPLTNSWSCSPDELAQRRLALQEFARLHFHPSPSVAENDIADTSFDLLLFVRFLPRQLLLALPALSRPGTLVVISHFYDLKQDPRWPPVDGTILPAEGELGPTSVRHRPRSEYDGPPPQARIAPGDMERLARVWDQIPTCEGCQCWSIVEQTVEPIEDGRPVLSTILRRNR